MVGWSGSISETSGQPRRVRPMTATYRDCARYPRTIAIRVMLSEGFQTQLSSLKRVSGAVPSIRSPSINAGAVRETWTSRSESRVPSMVMSATLMDGFSARSEIFPTQALMSLAQPWHGPLCAILLQTTAMLLRVWSRLAIGSSKKPNHVQISENLSGPKRTLWTHSRKGSLAPSEIAQPRLPALTRNVQ